MSSDDSLNSRAYLEEGDFTPEVQAVLAENLTPSQEGILTDYPEMKERITKSDNEAGENSEAIEKALIELEKINELGEEDKKTDALREFGINNFPLVFSPAEILKIREQADEHMDLLSGGSDGEREEVSEDTEGEDVPAEPSFVISDEFAAQEVWTEGELKELTGGVTPPEGYYWADEGADENYKIISFEDLEVLENAEMTAFLADNNLQEPSKFVAEVKDVLSNKARGDLSIGGRFSLYVLKGVDGLDISMKDNEFDPAGPSSPEWEKYQNSVQVGLADLGLTVKPTELNTSADGAAQDLMNLRLSQEDNAEFVARDETLREELEGILTEEGILADGTLPNGATRFDGSLTREEAEADALKKMRTAIDEGDWIAAASSGIAYAVQWIKNLIGGFGGGVESGAEGDRQMVNKPGNGEAPLYKAGESLYTMNGEKVDLKYNSYAEINEMISDPGDRVAAAAMLGVAMNQKCKDRGENHCSGWVETIADKVGFERYNNSQNSYVNPNHSAYRGWFNRSRNNTSFEESGLRPGDMVIARSSPYHDQIVVDVDPVKGVLVASQETLNRRALRWKHFTEDDIAVISRPGWNSAPNV